MDIGQRQPLQERSGTTCSEGTQGQASFHHGELPVVERHFKNEVVQRVQKELKAKHHFTTANCPWSNGTIESACKQVIRAFRAVLSELKMYADEWPEVVNMVQSVLNNS
jgi:hypothetical protein